MESPLNQSEVVPTNQNINSQTEMLDTALLMLSRLFGRQTAMDFVRDADILEEGEPE